MINVFIKLTLSFFLLNFFFIFSQEKYKKDCFISPLDIPLTLSGTFGEIRTNHFHAGIDIPTNQKTGYPIYSCADGYVSRIKVSPWGFGKAIYINHKNGLTTVYAHLENFNSEIQNYILKQQYQKKTFSLDISLSKSSFQVKQGQIIGFSGSSGNSTGPHLHFEVRESALQKPINPMKFSFPIKDTRKPIIKSIFIYEKKQNEKFERSEYTAKNNTSIPDLISGEFGIGVETYDKNDNSSIKTGVNTIKVFLDQQLYYHFELNGFLFSEKRYVNSHIDYKERLQSRRKIHKCFLEKNNKLKGAYLKINNKGILNNLKDGKHEVKIIVSDSYQNSSEITFFLNYENQNVEKKTEKDKKTNDYYINSNQDFSFSQNKVDIMIKKGNLYTDCDFIYKEIKKENNNTSYIIGDKNIPIHKGISIAIKPDYHIDESKNKLALAQLKNNKWSYIKSKWENGKIQGTSKRFGQFTIIKDTKKPTIKAINLKEDMSGKKSIKFKVRDNFSGINYYTATLNGEWILMEYDAKNNLLEHFFKNGTSNKKQKLILTVKDGLENEQKKEFYFKR